MLGANGSNWKSNVWKYDLGNGLEIMRSVIFGAWNLELFQTMTYIF